MIIVFESRVAIVMDPYNINYYAYIVFHNNQFFLNDLYWIILVINIITIRRITNAKGVLLELIACLFEKIKVFRSH